MCVILLSSHINLVVILVVILVDFCEKKVFGRGGAVRILGKKYE